MTPAPPARRSSLSVVIPAYNEEARLPATLRAVTAFLAGRGWDAEVLVVDDGSLDATAAAAEEHARSSAVPTRVLRNPRNLGKGASVRRGLLEAARDLVLFSDADLSTPIEEAERMVALAEEGCDVVIGTRAAAESRIEVRQAWYREWMGKGFNLLVRLLADLPYRDTQCGFKLFRREVARELAAAQRVERFGFDVELLFLARRRGRRVCELPVVWRNSPYSRVNPVTDSARMAWDLVLIRLRELRGLYRAKPT